MKKTLFSVLLIIGSIFLSHSQTSKITRIENSPYPASSVPDKLFLTSENYSYSQKIALLSLQGMLARTKPEILRDVHKHASVLENYVTIDRTYYNNFNGLLARYADRFAGYILCEARTSSVNVAFSLSHVLNAIAIPVDLEQTAIATGYQLVLDVRGKNEAWAIANYGDNFSKTIASYQAVNDDRALFLGDYSVFAGALQFWDPSVTGSLANSVYSRMNPSAVYFGWGPGEYNTVEQLSKRSAMIHPADWSPNLSALSNIPVKLPRQKAQKTPYKVVPNVHTVCFVISDGDNIQWLSGTLENASNWSNPDKGRLNLGWTVSPAFAELAPTIYKRYIENALTSDGARNYLVAGPSGTGYYFPSLYPALAEQTKTMNQMMRKADLNIVNIIDQDGSHNPTEYLKQSNVDALFYYSYGGQYTKLAGAIKWYKDKPSIGGRFTLWGNSDDGSAETRERVCQGLANTLNKQSTNIYSTNGYSLIPVHIWTMNPSDVLNVINKLNPNVRVVSPDEFIWLIRKNLRNPNLGDGNGLRAEYSLENDLTTPVLSTNEPTIDYDDEFLTEGTETMAENNFTVRWFGKIQPIYSETYTFHANAKGGVILKVNGRVLCDSINNSAVSSSDTISLSAGKKYDIEYSYKKTGTKGQALLEWESLSQVRQRIPFYQLFSKPFASTGLVTVYENENYEGYSSGFKFGNFSSDALAKLGLNSESMNSIKVTPGYKVVFYSEDNFSGDSIVLENDTFQFGEWKNRIKSMRITNSGADLPDGIYYLKPKNSDNTVGIEGNYQNSINGQKARLFRNTGNINLQFRFTRQNNGTYNIQSISSGKNLEIENFSKSTNASVQQWKASDAENQKFMIVPSEEDGFYKIYSLLSEKIIEVESLSSSALVRQTDNQNSIYSNWQIEPVPPLPNGKGDGLTAEYYNGQEFNTLMVTTVDTTINFNWGTNRPNRNINADNVSIRWQGKIEPRTSGDYQFFINSDNGRRLWINDQLIIDKWINDYDIEYSGNIMLQAGELYNIKLDYFESIGGAYCKLEWISPKQPREIVPKSQLYSLNYNGIEESEINTLFSIFPNPAKDVIRVSGNTVNEECLLQIKDISGKIIDKQTISLSNNQIDISQLPVGVYFVSLSNEKNVIVKKLIKK